jgi:hypothetical protein
MNNAQPPSPSSRRVPVIALLSLIVATLGFLFGNEILCKLGADISTCAKPQPRPPNNNDGGGGGSGGGDNGNNGLHPDGSWSTSWQGRIRLPNNAALELDSVPAQPVNGAWTGADLNFDNREALGMWLYAGPALAEWSGPGVPGAAECDEALVTSRVAKIDPAPGQTLCVGTTDNQVARLQIVDAQYQGVQFDTVVWKGA